jgi:hypothetical protein
VQRVEGCCPREGEEEGGGRLQQIGERERGSARVGEERGLPSTGSKSMTQTRSPI